MNARQNEIAARYFPEWNVLSMDELLDVAALAFRLYEFKMNRMPQRRYGEKDYVHVGDRPNARDTRRHTDGLGTSRSGGD